MKCSTVSRFSCPPATARRWRARSRAVAETGAHPALGNGRGLAAQFAREKCLEQFRAFVDQGRAPAK